MKKLFWLILAMLIILASSTALAASKWESDGTYTYYTNSDGTRATGIQWIGDAYYIFDEEGRMQTGFFYFEGRLYHTGEDGKVVSGWLKLEWDVYYADLKGQIVTGKQFIDGSYYYFDEDGRMLTGFLIIDDSMYFFGEDGKGAEGWFTMYGDTYYAYAGQLYVGNRQISDGKTSATYYFDESGRMQTGIVEYTLDYKGQPLPEESRAFYYHDEKGRRQTGWVTLNGEKYYFAPRMCTGFFQITPQGESEPRTYYFNPDGTLHRKDGVVTVTDSEGTPSTYFIYANGTIFRGGWKTFKGKTYYFTDRSGAARKGEMKVQDGNVMYSYFFDDLGVMQTGWVNTGTTWEYAGKDGKITQTPFQGMKEIVIPKEVDTMVTGLFSGVNRHFVIKCEAGSYAEAFARRYGFQYDNGKKRAVGATITDVTEKVNWIVSNYITAGMSEEEKALALHNWIIFNARYDMTYRNQSPAGVLTRGYGVFQSYAEAYEQLLTRAGLANRLLTGTAHNSNGWIRHAWNLVRIDGQWYHVDPTWDDPLTSTKQDTADDSPVVTGYERTKYFLVTDKEIAADHQWDAQISADKNQVGSYHESVVVETETFHTDKAGVKYRLNDDGTACVVSVKSQKITGLSIPDSVKENGTKYSVTSIDPLGDLPALKKVSIGKNITTLPDGLFQNCSKLKTVSGCKGVTEIGASAFRGCSALKEITIPANVNRIGADAFRDCKKLSSVTIKSTSLSKDQIGNNAFSGLPDKVVFRLPSKLLKSYKKVLLKKGAPKAATFSALP